MAEPIVYRAEEIVPIPARCQRCGYDWVDKERDIPITLQSYGFKPLQQRSTATRSIKRLCRDAIRAPSLRGCQCGWCGGTLVPHPDYPPVIDAETARRTHQRPLPLFEEVIP